MKVPKRTILIISSIYLQSHNTIYAFISSLASMLQRKGYSVEIIHRDKSIFEVYLLDTVRYCFWLLGVKGLTQFYVYSILLTVRQVLYLLKKKTRTINKTKKIYIANDEIAGYALLSLGKGYLLIIHGKLLYEILAENPRLLITREKILAIRRIESLTIYYASKIIISDESLKKHIRIIVGDKIYDLIKDKIYYIPNIVDIEKYTPKRRIINKAYVITHIISSSTLGKDYKFLVETLKVLKVEANKKIRKPIIILIVGDTSKIPSKNLDQLKKLNDKHFRIVFLGKIPNEVMPIIYSNSDIVLNPLSKFVKGISRVNLEAMLCGTVPVTTPEGNVYPIINNVSGVVVQRDPQQATEVIINLLGNNEKLSNLKENMIKIARNFIRHVILKWDSILRNNESEKEVDLNYE